MSVDAPHVEAVLIRGRVMNKNASRASTALLTLINGFQVSQAIHVAARLGIADLLTGGPRSSEDLAAATGAHAPSLYRLLRALASVGVLYEDTDRRFSLTPLGDCLRSDSRSPVGPWASYIGEPAYRLAWGQLEHSVRTGETAFRHVHGMSAYEYRARNPEAGAIFDQAMTALSRGTNEVLLDAYDFGRFRCVVDLGGGQGALLAAILAKYRSVRGVLFDQPHVVEGAEHVLKAAGVADRCRIVAGSFFEGVPNGGDAYTLKFVLHNWADEEAVAILRMCRRAIAPDGALLAIEREVGPPNEDPRVKLGDLNMLVGPGGRERTRKEFEALFAAGGFRLVGATPTQAQISIIEGVPGPM